MPRACTSTCPWRKHGFPSLLRSSTPFKRHSFQFDLNTFPVNRRPPWRVLRPRLLRIRSSSKDIGRICEEFFFLYSLNCSGSEQSSFIQATHSHHRTFIVSTRHFDLPLRAERRDDKRRFSHPMPVSVSSSSPSNRAVGLWIIIIIMLAANWFDSSVVLAKHINTNSSLPTNAIQFKPTCLHILYSRVDPARPRSFSFASLSLQLMVKTACHFSWPITTHRWG